ncbi:uncharacterized protein N7459_009934 [Penicillium hispanicum]|uniref:uncharacterized protein n=1 Tax=Penicillium hispanicum TaxID=1080232 RepID=UPI002540F622|nr:uncharacterized protein N7459_009934 [Penicillium hispanicum]KAJ5570504.1 hypothetical protein N7459_009934 [Penicillium hispanicum]
MVKKNLESYLKQSSANAHIKDCRHKGDWKPTNTAIKYVTSESLSRTWSRFKKKGCDLTQYPRLADVYFSQSHINIRIAQIKEAKRLMDQKAAK